MTRPIPIPSEVVEAALKAYGCECNSCRKAVIRVTTAALNAWPGAAKIYRSEDEKLFSIILPLPQEPEQ